MKNVRVVVIGFACVLALGAVVLAIGLFRKASASAALDDLVAEADKALRLDLADFVAMSEDEQGRRGAEARKIQRRLQADPKAPASKGSELGQLLARCAAVRAEVDKKRRELTRLRRVLSYTFPDDADLPKTPAPGAPRTQIAPGKSQELREAIRLERKVRQDLTVSVGGRPVDLTPAFEQDLAAIGKLKDLVGRELDQREQAFQTFVIKMEELIRTAGVKEAAKRTGDFDAWFPCVVSCPPQRQKLEDLEGRISQGSRQPDREKIARARADGLLRSLRSPYEREKQAALGQFAQIAEAARQSGVDPAVLAELDQVREAIDRDRRAKAADLAQAEQRMAQMEQALLKIAPWAEKTAALRKANKTDPDAELQWVNACAGFDDEVDKMILDAGLKAFLKQAMRHANPAPFPPPKPPKVIKEYRGPDWGFLKPSYDRLRQVASKHGKINRRENQDVAKIIREFLDKAEAFQANIDRIVKSKQPAPKPAATQPATQPPPPGPARATPSPSPRKIGTVTIFLSRVRATPASEAAARFSRQLIRAEENGNRPHFPEARARQDEAS